MKEISNQWRTEKQHHIHGETYEHIKPEYRIVVIVCRLLDIDKGLRKATALQITCNECKEVSREEFVKLYKEELKKFK